MTANEIKTTSYSESTTGNQTQKQQAATEFNSAVKDTRVAIAPAVIGWYALNAAWINPLIYTACVGLGAWAVNNIIKIMNNEPQESLTATQINQLSKTKEILAQDPRFESAPIEILKQLGIDTNLKANDNSKAIFRSLYNQTLQKSLENPNLTSNQRANLIALEGYVFKADETPNGGQGANSDIQEGSGGTKKNAKLKKPKKPKIPKASKPVVDKLSKEASNVRYVDEFRALFSNPETMPHLIQMLEIAKFTLNKNAKFVPDLKKFIDLAQKNFISRKYPIMNDIMDMAIIAKRLGLY
jgi:hypothetical protein